MWANYINEMVLKITNKEGPPEEADQDETASEESDSETWNYKRQKKSRR
jgi:hypothetical protein